MTVDVYRPPQLPPMLAVRGVAKRYGTREALSNVTLEVPEGETVAVLGPSGCGKSTLLRVLSGLLSPDRGSVFFAGAPMDRTSSEEVRRGMGLVVQGGGLFPHLTARENVTLVAQHLRWDARRVSDRLDALLELTHLPGETLARYPAELSGGQRQRVSLMRALMLDPKVLLFDEPLGALDPITRFDMQQELHDTFRLLRKTVVLVTHDLTEAAFFSRRLVLMRAGQIEQQGPLTALRDQPATDFVSRFVGAHRPLTELPLEAS